MASAGTSAPDVSTLSGPSASSLNMSPDTSNLAAVEKPPDESSKLRMFLGILKKFIGVADIASVRFSLPAQLLEPTPNLEYWTYLDRPETFVAIGDSEEPLDRMLEVLRFWFTKDLKYVKGKPCKPYNSTLGEFFRCNWEVDEASPSISKLRSSSDKGSASSSIKSDQQQILPDNSVGSSSATQLQKPITVSFLTEQTSHHPPVSAYYIDCPEKGISARGYDQLSAKFTGTSIRVIPGEYNEGIFVTIHRRDEEQYQLKHPAAYLGGLLRGSLSVTVSDQCTITCPKTKIKTILQYVEEGWLGKTQNKVEGVIYSYDPEKDDILRLKDVPDKDVLARITGNWRDKLYFSIGPKTSAERSLLVDLEPLTTSPKAIPPMDLQLVNESMRFWSKVTEAIIARQFSLATTLKQEIEERQRQKAKERQDKGVEWEPRFFQGSVTPPGKPELTPEGIEALKGCQQRQWELKESDYTAS